MLMLLPHATQSAQLPVLANPPRAPGLHLQAPPPSHFADGNPHPPHALCTGCTAPAVKPILSDRVCIPARPPNYNSVSIPFSHPFTGPRPRQIHRSRARVGKRFECVCPGSNRRQCEVATVRQELSLTQHPAHVPPPASAFGSSTRGSCSCRSSSASACKRSCCR
jgi:hypothetical protein